MINYGFSIYDLEYFLLILVRVASFVYLAPFFSMSSTPRNVRIAISFFISALLYHAITPAQAVVVDSVVEYAVIVIKEAVAGLLIGLSTQICTSIFAFAGHIADMEIGLSMVQLMDPNTRQNTSFTGALYNYAFTLIMIASGLYRYLLGALADTFTLIPINGAVFHSDRLLNSMVVFLSDYVLIGFRIILPIFACILMLNAVLGIIAKVAPQINMFVIGIQLKVLVGLSVLFLMMGLLPTASDMIYSEMKKMMVMFVESMGA